MKLAILGEEFRAMLLENLENKNTADRYFFAVRRLLSDLQFNTLAQVEREELERRMAAIKKQSDYSAAKNGLLWLKKYDGSLQLPSMEFLKAEGAKKRNYSTRPPKTLYLDTINRKINAIRNEKLKYAYRLMLVSGLRVSETAALTRSDFTIENGQITVRVRFGKGGKEGVVTCMSDPYLAKRLPAYLAQFTQEERIFYSTKTMRAHALELGLECHDLRRVAAIQYRRGELSEAGVSFQEANERTKDFLRHARFSTTKRYLFNRKLTFRQPKEEMIPSEEAEDSEPSE